LAGAADAVLEGEAAGLRDGDVHEDVDVVGDVALVQAVFFVGGDRQQKTVATAV